MKFTQPFSDKFLEESYDAPDESASPNDANKIVLRFFDVMMRMKPAMKDFFRFTMKEELLSQIDLDSVEVEQESFVDSEFENRSTGLLYQVLVNGKLEYFYLLCELNKEESESLPLRMLECKMRILRHHLKKHPGEKLPLVRSFVMYAGRVPFSLENELIKMFADRQEGLRVLGALDTTWESELAPDLVDKFKGIFGGAFDQMIDASLEVKD